MIVPSTGKKRPIDARNAKLKVGHAKFQSAQAYHEDEYALCR